MSALLAAAQQVLVDDQSAYRRALNAEVRRGSESESLEIIDGSVTADGRTPGRWSGRIVVHSERVPTDPADVLAPFGSEVVLRAGARDLAGVASTVPLGVMPVQSTEVQITGNGARVTLSLGDRSARVAANRFASPLRAAANADLGEVAARVVANRDPRLEPDATHTDVTVGDLTDGEPYVFGLSNGTDPWRELTDLLNGGGLRCWFDRLGGLVVEQLPGTISGSRRVRADEATISYSGRPANVIVVRSSTSTSQAWGVWEDDDRSSPTYVDGPYGRVTDFHDAPVRSNGRARAVAGRIGQQSQGAGGTWRITRGFDPTWDPGDTLVVPLSGQRPVTLIVDSVTVDLTRDTTLLCRVWTNP